MKRFLLLLLFLNISLIISKKLMIVGFRNYKFDQSTKIMTFDSLLRKPDDLPRYPSLFFNVEVYSFSDSKENIKMTCSINDTYKNDENDLSYNCTSESVSLPNIKRVEALPNIHLYNSTHSFNITSLKQFTLSSLAGLTLDNVITQTGSFEYKTFTLKNISINGREYTLNGKLDIGSSIINASILFVEKYNHTCLVTNSSIKIIMGPNDSIVDKLNGKMLNRTNGDKILIDSNDNYDLIVYPILSLSHYIELLGFNELNISTTNRNATAIAHIRGPYFGLYYLRDYLKFTATIEYSNSIENIAAYGIKDDSIDNIKWIITYDIVFPNTENKDIKSITIHKDFLFSNDTIFSTTEDLSLIYPEVITQSFNKDNFRILDPERPDEIAITYTNTNFTGRTPLYSIINNQAPIYMSYIPYNKDKNKNEKKREEIVCSILERNEYEYKLKFHAKKSFFTYINTLEFIVESKYIKSRLRFLENNENITYAYTADGGGNLTFIYKEEDDYKSFIELLGIGDFNKTTTNRNATAKAYIRGPLNDLSNLKDYLKFTATIQFSNTIESITAIGNKIDINATKEIATYDIVFPNIENKDIKSVTIQKDFVFSNDITFSKIDNQPIIYPDVISQTFDEGDFRVLKIPTEQEDQKEFENSDLDLGFEFPDTIENQTKTYLSYIPYNNYTKSNEDKREEINDCNIYTSGNSKNYEIKCFPKKSFITFINTLKFIVDSKNIKRRLRFLQNSKNSTYSAPADAKGIITYTYEETSINKKLTSKKGLSTGAIVAIVLASVAAIIAVGLTFFFLLRKSPPPKQKKAKYMDEEDTERKNVKEDNSKKTKKSNNPK